MKGSDLISWVPAFTKISLNGFSLNFYTQKSVLKKLGLQNSIENMHAISLFFAVGIQAVSEFSV